MNSYLTNNYHSVSTTVFIYLLLLVIHFCFSEKVHSQDHNVHYQMYNYVFVSSNETPFWHHANTYGKIQDNSSFNNLTGIAIEKPFSNSNRRFDFSIGAEAVNRFSDSSNTYHFQQLFGMVEYRLFRLSLGRFKDTIGMNMTELSTGSMIQSRNATSIPKIKISVPNFVDVPKTNGIFQFKAHYSDGILEEDRFVKSPFIHQKSIYLKLNIENFEGIGGVIHNVVWAGEHSDRGHLPRTFSDYVRVVLARSAAPESGAAEIEEINQLGNSIAAYDFSARYHTNRFIFKAYRLFYLEDRVSTRFRSPWDGIWGIGFTRKNDTSILNTILYEHINTMQQDSQANYPRGRANYYNHSIYRNGWSYYNNVIGNPLLTFDQNSNTISNNMIIAHHIGISGRISESFNYKLFTTYSRNYGICRDRVIRGTCFINTENPFQDHYEFIPRERMRKDRYSILFELNYNSFLNSNLDLISSISIDRGEFQSNRFGVKLGIVKNFSSKLE